MRWPQAHQTSWLALSSESKGPLDEAEVAFPFLSQSQKSGRGPDLTSVPCAPRFKGKGQDPRLKGRVARSHYRATRAMGAIIEPAAGAHKKAKAKWSSSVVSHSLRPHGL